MRLVIGAILVLLGAGLVVLGFTDVDANGPFLIGTVAFLAGVVILDNDSRT